MKCIVAVVMTLAVVAQGGVVPVAYSAPHATVVQQNVPATKYVVSAPVTTYAAAPAIAPVATYAATQYAYNTAPVATYAAAPVAYAAAPAAVATYAAPHTTYVQQNVAPRYVAAPVAYTAAVAPAAAVTYSADSEVVETSSVVAAAPAAVVAAAPAVAIAHQPAVAVVAQQEARYVAANRGAVHEAPLAGHAVSQQSLNLEPAAGTL
ncbi:cuticle protein 16.5-like [Uranotaenia lowii]|uniref:cuticle protein 16.5-like n=1 Tax=Uranotaenia lowii TaxID=190385 RepID=UPI00247A63CD|nr:cuticle protein 16.5-like [Uranotaenia lowii]